MTKIAKLYHGKERRSLL